MGIRETLNQKPAVAIGAATVLVVLVLAFIAYNLFGDSPGSAGDIGAEKAFFSTDNGQTFFVDSANKHPPFDHDGKPAYQAFVWTCDGGRTKFVSHLQRYTKDAIKKIQDAQATGQVPISVWEEVSFNGVEIKPAGTPDEPRNWINKSDPNHIRAMQPRCPDGSGKTPEQVFPE